MKVSWISNLGRMFCAALFLGTLLLVANPLASSAATQSLTITMDAKGTYLHTNTDTSALPPSIVELSSLGISAGDELRIYYFGSVKFNCAGASISPPNYGLAGVFSSSNTLLSPSQQNRIPGAIDAGQDVFTSPTGVGAQPTDIPQDFRIFPPYPNPSSINDFRIIVPPGASHLFIGFLDSHFSDNCGTITITLRPDTNAPLLILPSDNTFSGALDETGTFYHTNNDSPGNPLVIDLGSNGFESGDELRISYSFETFMFRCTETPSPVLSSHLRISPDDVGITAVFSTSNQLQPSSELNRVTGAIDAGDDYVSLPTANGNQPTDIPEDFQITPAAPTASDLFGFVTTIPPGANFLFVAVSDSLYSDNCGPGDISVVIQSPQLTHHAIASSGGNVSFDASSIDLIDDVLATSCDPESGSHFQPGTTEVTCTSRDHLGNTASGAFNLLVRAPPSANAAADQTVNEGAMVSLDGSTSADPDGTIVSYLWGQTAGNPVTLSDSSAASPTFTAPFVTAQTLLSFTLTVTDNDGKTASDSVDITVNNINQVPSADAGADQSVNEGDNVSLDGSGSSDSDGTIQSYSWLQTAGTSVTLDDSSSTTPSFIAPSVGAAGETLTFELIVTDNDGDTDTDTVDINVQNMNLLPTAIAGEDFSVNEGTPEVQLQGSGSDSDGIIGSYLWEQTSGPSVILNNAYTATVTFDAPQVSANTPLTFKLTVTDNDGGIDDDTISVIVNDVENTRLEIEGFYAPVDMNNIINTIKATKSVPLKFEIFEVARAANGDEISRTEITDTSAIQSFTHEQIACSAIESTGTDAVEITNSLGTIEPRYDADSGQFMGNWKARGSPGICYTVEVTTEDDSATAYFKTK